MLQGVHADTIVFTSYPQARSCLVNGPHPLIGTASEFGGRDIKLFGTPPRRFRMRVTDLRERGKAISCQFELHHRDQLSGPLMRLDVNFVPDGANTRVRLRGSTVRHLSPASSTDGATSLGLANAYARALIDQIAKAMETRSAKRGAGRSAAGARP